MPGPFDDLLAKVTSVTGKWPSFAAFGSFFVYLVGYLALRFQLSTYGVATNLDVWDERYLFAGSRFLVYLVSSVPNVLLIVIVLWLVFFLASRLLPAHLRSRIAQGFQAWANKPSSMPVLGTLLAVALIQFVMRQCFVFGNLLLRQELPPFGWINGILLTGDGNRSLYFSGLVGGTLLTGAILLFAMRGGATATSFSKSLRGLLAFLFAVQFLLLPVNYGILIASQQLPRVAEVPGDERLASGEQAWLVWDSKEAIIFFTRRADDKRSLLTVPRKETKTNIVGYDAIFRVLFANPRAGTQEGNGRGAPMFMRATCLLGLVMCSVAFGVWLPQNPPPTKQPNAPARRTESFWHKVLRVSGIAQSPSTLRGPGDEVQHGQIWISDLTAGQTRKLTTTGGFRSPVFLPEGNDILALKGTDIVRVAFANGKVTNLFAVAGLAKLVGFTEDDPGKVLVLSRDSSGVPAVAFLSVTTGKLDSLAYDPSSTEDRRLVEYLSAWDRSYGDTFLYIDQQTKEGMAGKLSWADVFLKKGSRTVKDVSNCDGTNCGQPSLSPDGNLVAFVRSDEE